jgi:hypothetical protein
MRIFRRRASQNAPQKLDFKSNPGTQETPRTGIRLFVQTAEFHGMDLPALPASACCRQALKQH